MKEVLCRSVCAQIGSIFDGPKMPSKSKDVKMAFEHVFRRFGFFLPRKMTPKRGLQGVPLIACFFTVFERFQKPSWSPFRWPLWGYLVCHFGAVSLARIMSIPKPISKLDLGLLFKVILDVFLSSSVEGFQWVMSSHKWFWKLFGALKLLLDQKASCARSYLSLAGRKVVKAWIEEVLKVTDN